MQASWTAADKADGYAVKIYQQKTQKDGSKTWEDTGFGYDVDAKTTSIDMAMTVGGKAEIGFEPNLKPNETYKVGVRAIRRKHFGRNQRAQAVKTAQAAQAVQAARSKPKRKLQNIIAQKRNRPKYLFQSIRNWTSPLPSMA